MLIFWRFCHSLKESAKKGKKKKSLKVYKKKTQKPTKIVFDEKVGKIQCRTICLAGERIIVFKFLIIFLNKNTQLVENVLQKYTPYGLIVTVSPQKIVTISTVTISRWQIFVKSCIYTPLPFFYSSVSNFSTKKLPL